MSTRAMYGFKDESSEHWVYVHMDGYPEGAAEKFHKVLGSGKIWTLPRFEADEFAAGFVAANKDSSGNVRLATDPAAAGDTQYTYIVYQEGGRDLYVKAYQVPGGRIPAKATPFFRGSLASFIEQYGRLR